VEISVRRVIECILSSQYALFVNDGVLGKMAHRKVVPYGRTCGLRSGVVMG
jgi:hypothetical protein